MKHFFYSNEFYESRSFHVGEIRAALGDDGQALVANGIFVQDELLKVLGLSCSLVQEVVHGVATEAHLLRS